MRPPAVDEDDSELDAPIEDGKETVTLHELPPIFLSTEGDNSPTTRRIDVVFVFRKLPTKKLSYIDWYPIAEMSELEQLLEVCGPGTYCLQGREEDRRSSVKQVYLSVGSDQVESRSLEPRAAGGGRAPLDIAQVVATVTALTSPLIAFATQMMDRRESARREERELERQRLADERAREESRNQAFMETMTRLMTARNSDLEAMVRASNEQRTVAAAPVGQRLNEAYREGQAETLELIRAVKEEGLGGEDFESKILSVVEAFASGKKKADEDAAAAAPNGTAS